MKYPVLALLGSFASAEKLTDFYDWSLKYDIDFENGQDFNHRFSIWTHTDKFIEHHNNLDLNYKLEHNQFSHLKSNEKF